MDVVAFEEAVGIEPYDVHLFERGNDCPPDWCRGFVHFLHNESLGEIYVVYLGEYEYPGPDQ